MHCINCGKENEEGSQFCMYCGTQLYKPDDSHSGVTDQEPIHPEQVKQESKSSKQKKQKPDRSKPAPISDAVKRAKFPRQKIIIVLGAAGGLLLVAFCFLLNIGFWGSRLFSPPEQLIYTKTSASTNRATPAKTIAPTASATPNDEITPSSLSEILPPGVTYEVVDEQYTLVTSGEPVENNRIYEELPSTNNSGSGFVINKCYTENVKTIRVTDGIDSADVVIFTVRCFFKDGSSATVTFSTTENFLKARMNTEAWLFAKLSPGQRATIFFASLDDSSIIPDLKEAFIQEYYLSEFETDLLVRDEFLSSSQLKRALDNIGTTGELDLSFRVLIAQVIQIPQSP